MRARGDGIDGILRRALAAWVEAARRRAGLTLLLALFLSLAALSYTVRNLGVISDADQLFDESLRFRQLGREFDAAFPVLNDRLIVVIDAASDSAASAAAKALAARVRDEPDSFASAYTPQAGPFFDRNGLLYLELEELEEIADQLATAQPFLAEISRDPSLRAILGLLEQAVEEDPSELEIDFSRVLGQVEAAVRAAAGGRVRRFAFEELVLGEEPEDGEGRRYVFIQPRVDFGDFVPAEAGIRRLRALIRELESEHAAGASRDDLRARITGNLALASEELDVVSRQATLAGIASFVMVAAILLFALRSARLVLAILLTLGTGLVWTAGFAALAVGHLNVISMAFAVLFIGLGVDFGIHFCLRYRESCARSGEHAAALRDAAEGVGSSLVLCALTTATGFYAFVPTDYLGVAELGWIAGSGMLISLFCSLTLLPALLSVWRPKAGPLGGRPNAGGSFPDFPVRHPGWVCAVAGVAGLAAMAIAPRLRFDANPLRVRDPGTESVQTFEELVSEDDVNPWSIEVLADDLATADSLAERLEALPTVEHALTLSSYVPEHQGEKLEVLADIGFFLNLSPVEGRLESPSLQEQLAALRDFRVALGSLDPSHRDLQAAATRLGAELDRAFQARRAAGGLQAFVAALEGSLVDPILLRLEEVRTALGARTISPTSLPPDLRERLLTRDGRARVQVLPRADLNDTEAVERFVDEVRSVEPDVSGSSVYMIESGRTIVRALVQAFATAFLLVTLLLWLLWRQVGDVILVLAPLGLAALLTAAASVLLSVPLNFADVIVLPLLLGIGVDSGIHLVHRHRSAPDRALLASSTPRAVLWSAVTTIASFGSLAFSTHRGMSSLGQLLIVGVGFTLLTSLAVLPALIELRKRRRGAVRRRAAIT